MSTRDANFSFSVGSLAGVVQRAGLGCGLALILGLGGRGCGRLSEGLKEKDNTGRAGSKGTFYLFKLPGSCMDSCGQF